MPRPKPIAVRSLPRLWLRCLAGMALLTHLHAAEPAAAPAPTATKLVPPSVAEGRKFWAFEPVGHPTVPKVRQVAWVKSPVDAFILARLESEQIQPAPAVDRRALIRRATFDLTGLPPTPAEVESFVADTAPDAFARVVDRLLASERYGERWGRHWLDVARYADSNGLDENMGYASAWRYRDYVIRAFNRNKPYDQFLTEQLAGDLLPPTDDLDTRHERLTALGFLCIGPKLLAEPDKVKLEMDMIDEQIESFGRAFLASTLGCARCHDHKFDPVPTEDYYALAAIFKSTHTLDDPKTPATWHEPSVARPEDLRALEAHRAKVAEVRRTLTNGIAEASRVLLATLKTNALPAEPEKLYPAATAAEIARLRAQVKQLESEAPELPTTMGVMDRSHIVETLPVHLRGNHLMPGKAVARGVPQVMTLASAPRFAERQSGRLELAGWLADPEHPLTARVIVNRVWRWHFGQGLVASTDNFGKLGERPSHPELLDWLARRFAGGGWDLKALHRLLMLSSTYQMSARVEDTPDPRDPENRLLHRFPLRRLDAEEIRDALHAVAGSLDLAMGGKTLPLKSREYVFNHTSKDAITYDSPRRAVYLPVIRNHLYDLFQQFDFPDPAVATGNRMATVVAPQALLMMNSELVQQAAERFATGLLKHDTDDASRVHQAYARAYGRRATPAELDRASHFVAAFAAQPAPDGKSDASACRTAAWSAFCQSLLAANEFVYLE